MDEDSPAAVAVKQDQGSEIPSLPAELPRSATAPDGVSVCSTEQDDASDGEASQPLPAQIASKTRSGRRQEAASMACEELSRCQLGEWISDDALLRVLRRWKCGRNYSRTNVMPDGEISVASDLLGAVRRRIGKPDVWGL